jgi:hypothetical protein
MPQKRLGLTEAVRFCEQQPKIAHTCRELCNVQHGLECIRGNSSTHKWLGLSMAGLCVKSAPT